MSFGWALSLPISPIGHIVLKYSNNTHTGKKDPLLWVKLVFIEPSFSLFIFPHHHFILTVNQSCFNPVTSTSCSCYCLFFVWCSPSKPSLLVSRYPSITLWSLPELHFTSPTWPLAVEIQTVSNFHHHLSSPWFLNWKYSWVLPSVRGKLLLYKLDTTLLQQTLILEGTYKNPCSSRPLL